MSCDPIITFHAALQSFLPDSSKASEKSASSGVRPGSNRGLVFKCGHGSVLENCSGFLPAGKKIPTSP